MPCYFSLHVALDITATDGFASIYRVFASADANVHFDASLEEGERKRNKGEPLLFYRGFEFSDFTTMREQFAIAQGVVIEAISEGIRGDGDVVKPQLAIGHDRGIGSNEAALALAQHLDFGADEDNASLKRLQDFIVVARFAVLGKDFSPAL